MNSKISLQDRINAMVDEVSDLGLKDPRRGMISQMVETCLKMAREGHDSGQIKLVTHSLKEMRYAYQVFNRYRGTRKVSIYGSARTAEEHADYSVAVEFSKLMAGENWMAITGAGDGIMKAGHEGPQREASF